MKFTKNLFLTSATLSASLVAAQTWGNFSGQVSSIEYLIGNDYSLTSDLTIALNESWSLVDIIGRRDGQIGNKSVVFNTADNKYYAKIGYTNTATTQNDTELCFPPVPIRISLNQNNNGSVQLRLIDGSFDIGCIAKTRVESRFSSSQTPDNTIATTSLVSVSSTNVNVVTESGLSIDFKVSTTDASATSTVTSTTSEFSAFTASSTSTVQSTIYSSSSESASPKITTSDFPVSTLSIVKSSSAESVSESETSAGSSGIVIQTISSGNIEPTSSPVSTVFEVQTSSFVTFTTTSSSSAATLSTVVPKVSVSSSGNSSISGVDQSNNAAKMASVESSLYMGAFVTLLLAVIMV